MQEMGLIRQYMFLQEIKNIKVILEQWAAESMQYWKTAGEARLIKAIRWVWPWGPLE